MVAKNVFLFGVLVPLISMALVARAEALSRKRLLLEKLNESKIVIIGVVEDDRVLYQGSSEKPDLGELGRIAEVRVEKVLYGEVFQTKISAFINSPLTTESAIYSAGGRYLMFLKDVKLEPGLISKVRKTKDVDPALLTTTSYYSFVLGGQGCLYLGLDSELMDKFKISRNQYYEILSSMDSAMSVDKARNQKYTQSTKELIRIVQIKDQQLQKKAWETALKGSDDILRKSAEQKLAKQN